MTSQSHCHSCGMPVESGPYCQHCTDDTGALQSFEERVSRMGQFMKRQSPGLSDVDARAKSIEYMASMPAWQDHPEIQKRMGVKS
ncbi:MAG: hypothetical protein JXX14_22115 [Deltaproteobacteria bacterium]|nr:hypothetical protein [Deltaproteobacteria bacterium]